MKFSALVLACVLALAAPAVAQEWRDALAAADKAFAERNLDDATTLYRQALDGGAEGRDRVRAWHGIASAALSGNDFATAESAIESARAFIAEKFGADDLAMAGNRQL